MNFLSHYFIHSQLGQPYFNLGLILPDLARGAVKKFADRPDGLPSVAIELLLGCKQHYAADKQFHASTFFEKGSDFANQLLKHTIFTEPLERKWFLGHVLFEMVLDRILLRHFDGLGTQFYDDLHQVNHEMLIAFLTEQECRDSEKMANLFGHFKQARYVLNYTDNNLFTYSLSSILRRAGLNQLSIGDREILKGVVLEMEQTYFADSYTTILQLKQVFQ